MLKMKNLQSKAAVFAALIVLLILGGPVPAGSQTSQYANAWSVNNNADWTPFPPNSNPLGAPDGNCTGGTNANGYAEFTFPGLGIPGGDVVLGIELNVNYRSHTAPNTVELRIGGGAVGSKPLPIGGTQSSCSNSALVTVGGSTDLWGTSLTTADFNAGSVSVRIVQNANTVDIESVQLVVYHGSGTNTPPDCSGAAIANQNANASCQATISGSDITGVTDPDGDVLTITVSPTTLNLGANTVTVTANDGNGGVSSCDITVNVVDNTAPVISCPADITVDNDAGQCDAVVNFTVTATDNCDSNVDVVCTPPSGSTFQVGTTTVNCTATDDAGNQSSCSFDVTVEDTEDPVLSCPADITVDNDPGQCDAIVNFTVTATDNCDNNVEVVCTPPSGSTFPVGTTTVNCTATDDAGNQSNCSFDITVEDTEDPVITTIAEPIQLWPPNHKYHTISVAQCVTAVSDNCDTDLAVSDVVITEVSSDEPEDVKGGGDGKTRDDIVIAPNCGSVELRSERQGGGNGRVYTIHLAVTDDADNEGIAMCQVTVPHSQNGTPAVDDGAAAGYTVPGDCEGASKLAADFSEAELEAIIPDGYTLEQNHPNPFNPSTTITFAIREAGEVRLAIYNLTGQLIRTLHSGSMAAGRHSVVWDATDSRGAKVASGIYLYKLQAKNFVATKRLVLMK